MNAEFFSFGQLKNLSLILTSAILLQACKSGPDFGAIKAGMKSSEVVKKIGSPAKVRQMGIASWWLYDDPQQHIVVINSDTVANYLTKADADRIMRETLNAADSLHIK